MILARSTWQLVSIAQLQFDSSSIQYGFLQSSLTIGLLFGNTIYGRLISGSDCVKSYCFVTYLALGAYLAFGYRYASGISFIFLVGAGNAIEDVLLITSLQDLARDESESISLFSIRESLQSVAVVISTLLVSLFTSIAMFSILVTGLGVFSIMMVVVFQLNYLRKM